MPQNYFDQFQKADTAPPKNYFDQFEEDKPEESVTPLGDTYTGPDTFMEGVLNSGPEVLDTIGQSLKGYFKGATVDIPSTIYHGVKNTVAHPIDTLLSSMGPLGDVISGNDTMAPIREASANAGSDPEAFGRIMGQISGQPAVTAGVVKGAPMATRALGTPVAATGRIMKDYQPISGIVPGMFEPRLARILEAAAGRGIENVGEWMRRPAPIQSEVMPDVTSDVLEGNFESIPNVSPVNTQRALPPSDVFHYGPERNPVPPMGLPEAVPQYTPPAPKSMMRELPPSNVHYMGNGSPSFDINASGPRSITSPTEIPRIRVNSEGNFVDLNTGNTMDATGKVISSPVKLSEILEKPFHEMSFDELTYLSKQNLDRNVAKTVKTELAKRSELPRSSPFFYKNRKY